MPLKGYTVFLTTIWQDVSQGASVCALMLESREEEILICPSVDQPSGDKGGTLNNLLRGTAYNGLTTERIWARGKTGPAEVFVMRNN